MKTLLILLLGGNLSYILGGLLQKHFPLPSPDRDQNKYTGQSFLQCHIPLISASLLLTFHHGYLAIEELITLVIGLYLAIYDWQSQSYPLLFWLISFTSSIVFASPNWSTLALLFLAGLAQLGYIPIGAGDFLYLASISLFLDLPHLLGTIQVACLTGLLAFTLYRNKNSIPFIPFIYLGLILILTIKKLT